MVARRISHGDAAVGDGGRDDEGPGLDPIRHDGVLSASQPAAALDLDPVGSRSLDLGTHILQECDQVVDLGFLRRRFDDGVAHGQDGGEHGILGAHDRDLREGDPAAAQPARGLGEVVAVAVLDLRAEGPHRVDVQVHRPAPNPVAAGVTDDDPPETGEQRAQQDEAGPHLGRRLKWHEEPLRIAAGDLVDVGLRMVDGHADIGQDLGQDAHVLDFGHVGEAAALAGQSGGGHQLERGVLGAADADRALQAPAALDPEDLAVNLLGVVLPVKRTSVGHPAIRRPAVPAAGLLDVGAPPRARPWVCVRHARRGECG